MLPPSTRGIKKFLIFIIAGIAGLPVGVPLELHEYVRTV